MKLKAFADDGKAEAGSFEVFGGSLIDTLECGEQVRDVFRLDADTGVGDHVDHLAGLVFLHLALDGEGDGAFLGVLDGIVDYVDETRWTNFISDFRLFDCKWILSHE